MKKILFCKIKSKDNLTPNFERAVVIDEQTTVKLFLLNSSQMHIGKLELNSNIILKLYQIEHIIYTFLKIVLCSSIYISKVLTKYKSNTAYPIDNYTHDEFHVYL